MSGAGAGAEPAPELHVFREIAVAGKARLKHTYARSPRPGQLPYKLKLPLLSILIANEEPRVTTSSEPSSDSSAELISRLHELQLLRTHKLNFFSTGLTRSASAWSTLEQAQVQSVAQALVVSWCGRGCQQAAVLELAQMQAQRLVQKLALWFGVSCIRAGHR